MTELEQRFDEFSKTFAREHSRRGVLKLGLGLLGAAVASALPGRAWSDPGGNSAAAEFCRTVYPPGPQRGNCVRQAAQGGGPFVECEGDPTRICGDPANQVCCDPAAGEFCCPEESRCVTCGAGELFDPATCTCASVCAGPPPCSGDPCTDVPPEEGGCQCFETAEGTCACLQFGKCGEMQRCRTSADCPPGYACAVFREVVPPCGFTGGRDFCLRIC